MKFVHRFSPSVLCEMTVTDEPPANGTPHILECKWSVRPKRKHLREYVRWVHQINEHLAKKWNFRILHIVQVGPQLWEAWAYDPGKPAELFKKVLIGS